jgi:DNA polymerase IIIc chi subunit
VAWRFSRVGQALVEVEAQQKHPNQNRKNLMIAMTQNPVVLEIGRAVAVVVAVAAQAILNATKSVKL